MTKDQTRRASRGMDWLAFGLVIATILLAISPILMAARTMDCRYASATARSIMLCP